MIQTAVRALTLNIYNGTVPLSPFFFCFNLLLVEDTDQVYSVKYIFGTLQYYLFAYAVSDDMVFQFITTPPVSKYFSDVVCRLRKQCLHLDAFLHAKE